MEALTIAISIGEVLAGCFYTLAGLFFMTHAWQSNDPFRSVFRAWAGVLFLVGGFEELADSVVQEGSSVFAIAVQGSLTLAQVVTGGMAAWVIFKTFKRGQHAGRNQN